MYKAAVLDTLRIQANLSISRKYASVASCEVSRMKSKTILKFIPVWVFFLYVLFVSFPSWAGYTEFHMGGPVVVYEDDEPNKVIIKGNAVIVPAKIKYRGKDTEIKLLLDTGASRTMISADTADRLSINLDRERKTKVHVVGGAAIDAHIVNINKLTFGIHTKRNWDVIVVPHNGTAIEYDGLLGMDVLRGLNYRIDFKKNTIVWE